MKNDNYNGWANYETWNVALWIQNDTELYKIARKFRKGDVFDDVLEPYKAFRHQIKNLGTYISEKTPDDVAWNDPKINIDELDEMIKEL